MERKRAKSPWLTSPMSLSFPCIYLPSPSSGNGVLGSVVASPGLGMRRKGAERTRWDTHMTPLYATATQRQASRQSAVGAEHQQM